MNIATWCISIGAFGSNTTTLTMSSTSQDEIGRRSTCAAAWISGSSETTLRLRMPSQMSRGSMSSATTVLTLR